MDFDERVRSSAIAAICDAAVKNLQVDPWAFTVLVRLFSQIRGCAMQYVPGYGLQPYNMCCPSAHSGLSRQGIHMRFRTYFFDDCPQGKGNLHGLTRLKLVIVLALIWHEHAAGGQSESHHGCQRAIAGHKAHRAKRCCHASDGSLQVSVTLSNSSFT